jgi:disulfide bond formation protein DsbB
MLLKVSNLINKIKQDVYLLIFVASSLAIIGAYVAEFVFHLQPCIWSLYQRIPYFLLIVFSLITLLAPITRQYLRFVISLSIIAEIVLASYHVGVERYISEDSHVCQVQNGLNSTIQDMLSA